MITPTTITTEDQIYLCNSPINLRLQNLAQNNTIKSVVLEVYIWRGALNSPPTNANYTFPVTKVSQNDDYINIQVSEVIAAEIEKPTFEFVAGYDKPICKKEGVFWQYKYQITNADTSIETAVESQTNFATLGYRYSDEHLGYLSGITTSQPFDGLKPIDYVNRNFSNNLLYWKREFDFTKTLGTATTDNLIKYVDLAPTHKCKQLGDKPILVYLNRWGLFDVFTPFGKVVIQAKVEASTNTNSFRNPNSINANLTHFKSRTVNESIESYTINTGYLTEAMTDQVEELIYSPLVYLVMFDGSVFESVVINLTADNDTVTADNDIITADAESITLDDLELYSGFKQKGVVCTNDTFVKKTRLNNKGEINYELNFEVTANKINNIR